MIKINSSDLVTKVREIAKAYPDVIYPAQRLSKLEPSCSYEKPACGPGKGCLIGQALSQLGLPEAQLAVLSSHGGILSLAMVFGGSLFSDFTEKWQFPPFSEFYRNIAWLQSVQRKQDRESHWGIAVEEVDNREKAI
jgi:hypothetical protein